MKKILLLSLLVFSTAIFSNLAAQEAAPPGAGDRDVGDKNIKMRSAELERIDRAARQHGSPQKETDQMTEIYPEIKKDYEQLQMSQDAIIKAYQSGSSIDYAQMSKSALEINGGAIRLKANLFPASPVNASAKKETKENEKAEKETKSAKSIRDLIVELDNAVGSFATSTMFQNLRVVDPLVSEKARVDLEKIIELSGLLNTEAAKIAGK